MKFEMLKQEDLDELIAAVEKTAMSKNNEYGAVEALVYVFVKRAHLSGMSSEGMTAFLGAIQYLQGIRSDLPPGAAIIEKGDLEAKILEQTEAPIVSLDDDESLN